MNKEISKNYVNLSAELVRMAQVRSRQIGTRLESELARMVAEEWIMTQENEDFLLSGETMSLSDNLCLALDVNDLLLGGRRIDIRPLEADGTVAIDRALIGSDYLVNGSLVVALDAQGGAPVGFVKAGAYLSAQEKSQSWARLHVEASLPAHFSPRAYLEELLCRPEVAMPPGKPLKNLEEELDALFNDRESLLPARQKQIFSYLASNWSYNLQREVDAVKMPFARGKVTKVLSQAGLWNARVEATATLILRRFPQLERGQVVNLIQGLGERFGSAIGCAPFKDELFKSLANMELAELRVKADSRAMDILKQVIAGIRPQQAVAALVNSPVALELAQAIKSKRQALSGFVGATGEEIGAAIKSLSLQPAYATHSSDAQAGVEAINDALVLLSVGEVAQALSSLSEEI